MKIIESFILGKKNIPELCEDGLFISEKIIAVIDGVTAKGSKKWQGKSSGCYAKDKIMEYLSTADYKLPASEFIFHLNQSLSLTEDTNEKRLSIEEYPRAAIILYNDYYKEVWCYGDCQCIIDGHLYTHEKEIDKINSYLRAFTLEYSLLHGAAIQSFEENDPGREMIKKTLLMQFSFENKKVPFGYPILNGFSIEPSFLKIYPVSEGMEIVLASDGYPILKNSFIESEKILSQLQKIDPLCFRENKSTKGITKDLISFDDRTYCRFMI